jgi:hypothetical protein
MNRSMLGGLLLALATAGLFPVAHADPDERRVDDGFYTIDEPAEAVTGTAATLVDRPDAAARAAVVPQALAELRARHAGELQTLAASLATTRDQQTCAEMQRQVLELKRSQRIEELQWLKAEALARGDTAYAGRLDEALGMLEAGPRSVAVTPVLRDPATGRALDGRDAGGVR